MDECKGCGIECEGLALSARGLAWSARGLAWMSAKGGRLYTHDGADDITRVICGGVLSSNEQHMQTQSHVSRPRIVNSRSNIDYYIIMID